MPTYRSQSEKETREFGACFAKKTAKTKGKPKAILLFGDLGAGKTAFSKGFAHFFGVKRVLSPSFNIIKSYKVRKNGYERLLHVDLYRVKNVRELKGLNLFNSLKEKGTIALIEWPEVAGKRIPGDKIKFSHGTQENERLISYN
jgi:tRNA threonylcarbamoyl adenosine modification protein YjeE